MNAWLRAGLIAGLVLLGAAQIPHVWSERAQRSGTSPQVEYSGATATYNDEAMTYWGWMRQAREGRFLMEDRMTPEDHPREYINILFYALGRLARLGGWSLEGVYAVARVAFGALLVLLLARLARRLFDTPAAQLGVLLMFLLASGWEGAAAFYENNAGGPHVSSPAWWMPEMSTFFSLMLYPHFLAGFAAMIGAVLLLLRAWDTEGLDVKLAQAGRRGAGRGLMAGAGPAAGAGVLMALLTFFHPYDVIPIFALLWTAPLLFGLAGYGWLARDWVPPVVASALWLPAFLYNYVIFLRNPAMRAWDLQNLMTTPEVDRLFIALGLNFLLAAIAVLGLRRLERRHLVMAAWLLTVMIIVFLPLRFQRRMMGGMQFPMAALAAVALTWAAGLLVRRVGGAPMREHRVGAVMFGLVLLLLPLQSLTPYYLLQREWQTMKRMAPPAWLRTETAGILRWLELNGRPDSRVLSSYEVGNYVPAKTGLRCVLGHYALTIDAESKRAEIARFYSADGDDAFRIAAVRRWRVRYVLHTPFERRLGPFDPEGRTWLKEVFRAGEDGAERAIVYEAVGAAAPPVDPRASSSPSP